MTLRRVSDRSLIGIYICRHSKPGEIAATLSSTGPCPKHGIDDCLMYFQALSSLQETAGGDSKRQWDGRRGTFARDTRDSDVVAVRACRYSDSEVVLSDNCEQHGGDCADTFVAASFLAGYTISKQQWRTLQTDLLGDGLPALLLSASSETEPEGNQA